MRNKKIIAGILIALMLIAAIIYGVRKSQLKTGKKQGEPEQSVEEILNERLQQASKKLSTPLGAAMANRNWAEVARLYQPERDFASLGEIIRSLFAENKMKDFKTNDQDQLLSLVLSTFNQLGEKNYHLAGILISQYDRLAPPKTQTENYAILKKWLADPGAPGLKKRLALTKLSIQEASPDSEALSLYQKTFVNGDTFGESRARWIERIDEVRNVAAQKACVEVIAKNLKKIPDDALPSALVLLSGHLENHSSEVKNMAMQFLELDQLPKFESALKAISKLLRENRLLESDKAKIVKRLTALPGPVQTPFVKLKSHEILALLGHT